MNLRRIGVEPTLGNPQAKEKNKQKTLSRPYAQIAPFIVYHDMEDRGNLEEGKKRLLGKDTSRPKGKIPNQKKVKIQKRTVCQ